MPLSKCKIYRLSAMIEGESLVLLFSQKSPNTQHREQKKSITLH
jgi:hypothetical protein